MARGADSPRATVPRRLAGDEVEEIPLPDHRDVRNLTFSRRKSASSRRLPARSCHRADLVMRSGVEFLGQPQLIQYVECRRVDGVPLKSRRKVAVPLQHGHLDPGSGQQQRPAWRRPDRPTTHAVVDRLAASGMRTAMGVADSPHEPISELLAEGPGRARSPARSTVLEVWDATEHVEPLLIMARSANDPDTSAAMLRGVHRPGVHRATGRGAAVQPGVRSVARGGGSQVLVTARTTDLRGPRHGGCLAGCDRSAPAHRPLAGAHRGEATATPRPTGGPTLPG